MARVLAYFSIFAALLLAGTQVALAEPQRMAIPPQEIVIGGGGGSAGGNGVGNAREARAYCVDPHLSTPMYEDFTNLLGPGSQSATVTRRINGSSQTESLSKAISNEWIKITGNNNTWSVLFQSLDGAEYTVNITNAFAVSNDKAAAVDDISGTLAWIDENAVAQQKAQWEEKGYKPLWKKRLELAKAKFGDELDYAKAFSSKSENEALATDFWQARLEVENSTSPLVYVGHFDNGGDQFQRVVMRANEPLKIFDGPNADRKVTEYLSDIPDRFSIIFPNPLSLEGADERLPGYDSAIEAREAAENAADEEAWQLANQEVERLRKISFLNGRRSQLGLFLTDSASRQGNSRFTVSVGSDDSVPAIGIRDGVLQFFDQNGNPTSLDIQLPREVRDALDDNDTTVGVGEIGDTDLVLAIEQETPPEPGKKSFIPSIFEYFFTLLSLRSEPEGVVEDLTSVISYYRDQLQDAPTGEAGKVKVFANRDERVNMRLVIFDEDAEVKVAIVSFGEANAAHR